MRTHEDNSEFDGGGTMRWEQVDPPVYWPAAKAAVVADRYLPDGTRQHMLPGSFPAGMTIGNAEIIGSDDAPLAEFSARLSHLSAGPQEWVATANRERPHLDGVTPWFSGDTHPERIGWYERHFHHTSQVLGCKAMNWWDGTQWLLGPDQKPSSRQAGSYPAWRGKMSA